VKNLDWSIEKNRWLKENRGICFEEVVKALLEEDLLDIISNPSSNFPSQYVFVLKVRGYVFYVPFVEDEDKIFLKTIIPSRKAQKKYRDRL